MTNVRYGGLVRWESAGAEAGDIDSAPGFLAPDSGDLHLAPGSACTDRGTSGSTASDDFNGVPRPQGDGRHIGAFEYVRVSAEDGPRSLASSCKRGLSIIRGVLLLTGSSGESRGTNRLLDETGREEMELRSGPNDVRALCPGVYFVRDEAPVADQRPRAVRKAVTS